MKMNKKTEDTDGIKDRRKVTAEDLAKILGKESLQKIIELKIEDTSYAPFL